MAENKVGIKETTELVEGALELALFIIIQARDGLDLSDVTAAYAEITGNDEFRDKVMAAAQGVQAVGGELADLDVAETVALTSTVLNYVPRLVGQK